MELDYLQDPLHVFNVYVSLKTHFTTIEYDYGKYKIKKHLRSALDKRKDKMFFYHIAKVLNENQIEPFFVAQFMVNHHTGISNIALDKIQSIKNYNTWLNRIELLDQNILFDINTIKQQKQEWKDLLLRQGNNYPTIFRLVTSNRINPETYTLLNKVFDFIPKIMHNSINDRLLYSMNLKYLKYSTFLKYPLKSLAKIIPKKLLDK